VHLVSFITEIYYDARSYKRQISSGTLCIHIILTVSNSPFCVKKSSLYIKLCPRPEWKDKHTVRLYHNSIPPHQQQLLHMKDSPYL